MTSILELLATPTQAPEKRAGGNLSVGSSHLEFGVC